MENFLEKKYKEYTDWWEYSDDSCNLTEEQSNMYLKLVDEGLQWAPLSQEEFINKIKTDDEFSKKWDIIIETREFDFEDRAMLSGQFNENTVRVDQFIETYGMRLLEQTLDEYNIPTKLTTIKYKNETIQIWETLINNTQTFCKTFLTTE